MTITQPELLTIAVPGESVPAGVNLHVVGSGTRTSPHTGRELRTVEVRARVGLALADDLGQVLRASHQADGAVVTDSEGGRWRVGALQESYSDAGGPHTFDAELWEVEVLEPKRLELGGTSFRPAVYSEEANDDGYLTVTARAVLDETQLAALRRLHEEQLDAEDASFFPVARVGLENRARSMRLDQVLWQEADAGAEILVTLVEEGSKPALTFPVPAAVTGIHALKWAATTAAQFEALLSELRGAGVLTTEMEERVRASAEGALRRRAWDLAQVADIDDWA